MINQKFGYTFSEEIQGFGLIEYTDTQSYPNVTFQVTAGHKVVKDKVIKYLSTPRKFWMPDMAGASDMLQKAIAPTFRVDYFQRALAEMNAAIGVASISQ